MRLAQSGALVEALGRVILVGGLQDVGCHDVGRLEHCLTLRGNDAGVVGLHVLICVIYFLGDDVAKLVVLLPVEAVDGGRIGGAVLVVIAAGLVLRRVVVLLCVPSVPDVGVVDIVGEHVAQVVTQVVGFVEHVGKSLVDVIACLVLLHDGIAVGVRRSLQDGGNGLVGAVVGREVLLLLLCRIKQCFVFLGQHHVAGGIEGVPDLAAVGGDVCLVDEQLLLRVAQHEVVPVGDGVVELVGDVAQHNLVIALERCLRRAVVRRVVGIVVGLHLQELHPAVRGRGDGERDVDHLAVGVGHTGVGRDVLVVDIDGALDEPIVCRHTVGGQVVRLVSVADVVAVIDDGLGAVYEVARRLPLFLVGIVEVVTVFLARDGTIVQSGQGGVGQACRVALAVYVLGIDEAAAQTGLHVDEVQLHHAGDVAPVLLVEPRAGALLGGQLQIDAGSQGHLVVAVAVVAFALVVVGGLPVVEGGGAVGLAAFACRTLVGGGIVVVRGAYVAGYIGCAAVAEIDVAGQGTEEVHLVVDAEVVAVVGSLVERHLAHTVDGVVGVVHGGGHTVLCALHHHAAAPYAAEVGTLYGVHDATGIARANAVLHPVGGTVVGVGHPEPRHGVRDDNRRIAILHGLVLAILLHDEQRLQLVGRDGGPHGIGPAVVCPAGLCTFVAYLVVGGLTVREGFVFLHTNRLLKPVEVGAVVGDVQFAVAVDERQVAVAVQTAGMARAYGDEVAVIDVMDGCRGVAEDCGRGGIYLGGAWRGVAAAEDGVVDKDAFLVHVRLGQAGPSCIALVAQVVQVFGGYILSGGKVPAVDGDVGLGLAPRLHEHLAVLGEDFLRTNLDIIAILIFIIVSFACIIVARAILLAKAQIARILVGAVDEAYVAATEDVALAAGHAVVGAHLAAMNVYLCLPEDVALAHQAR